MTPLEQFSALPPDAQARAIARLPPADQQKTFALLRQMQEHADRTKFYRMFPETGPFRRELYYHHTEFFDNGAWSKYRAFIGGNGVGKTEYAGGYELCCHLTGEYPAWWKGKRWSRPIKAWIGGDTLKTVRDIVLPKLLGPEDARGTGVFPASSIGKIKLIPGGQGAIDNVRIRHKPTGKWSTLWFKSYDQSRDAWQGEEIDFIDLDEQCPTDIFEECISRFRGISEDGRLILTFTGLKGATDVALLFLPELADPSSGTTIETMRAASRSRVVCPMDDVPHLSKEWIAEKLANYSGAARETRRTGIPYTGSGRIYRVDESVFVVEPFAVPRYWSRVWAADFGFGSEENGSGTACVWGAWDRENDIVYIYNEYFQAEMPRSVHAAAIKGRGSWIPGVGDYAGKADSGLTTMAEYQRLGLDIQPANKAVEAGIDSVTERLSQGRLKVFSTCTRWLGEYRLYQYAPNGTIKKERDHLMDSTRYLVMSGLQRAKVHVPEKQVHVPEMTFGL